MNTRQVRKVAEGAYFLASYSEQTIIGFQPGITNQTIVSEEETEELEAAPLEEEHPLTGEEFE